MPVPVVSPFITTDTKGDLYRNYGGIAHDYYGYNISVIDLRNPPFFRWEQYASYGQ
mgnify:CR=1 FL=1